jgi:hypothetical protein
MASGINFYGEVFCGEGCKFRIIRGWASVGNGNAQDPFQPWFFSGPQQSVDLAVVELFRPLFPWLGAECWEEDSQLVNPRGDNVVATIQCGPFLYSGNCAFSIERVVEGDQEKFVIVKCLGFREDLNMETIEFFQTICPDLVPELFGTRRDYYEKGLLIFINALNAREDRAEALMKIKEGPWGWPETLGLLPDQIFRQTINSHDPFRAEWREFVRALE